MNNKIELIQGDTSPIIKFKRKNSDGTIITTRPMKMWITFKESCNCVESLFQKTLDNGITFDGEYYKFQIESDDTSNLAYGTYGFDIAIINEAGEKKTLSNNGELKIVKHYTMKSNEV